jgi:undecaprenyl diphosphate synthase
MLEGSTNGERATPAPERRGPRHVAIICDGNARWAARRGLSVTAGHEAAADTALARVDDAARLGIDELTIYSFSTENWARPREEIDGLVRVFARRVRGETPRLAAAGVRMRFIGRREHVAPSLASAIEEAEAATAHNDRLRLFVAFDYGGRAEIVDAALGFSGSTEKEFRERLYAPEMHDPDVIVRTGGERRLSNYLLWQAAYAELVFREELWPDFDCAALEDALDEYAKRQRRFGQRIAAGKVEPCA